MTVKIVSRGQQLVFDAITGTFSMFGENGSPLFEGAGAGVTVANGRRYLLTSAGDAEVAQSDEAITMRKEFPSRRLAVSVSARAAGEGGFVLSLCVQNTGHTILRGLDLLPLVIRRAKGGSVFGGSGKRDFRTLRNGLLTWSNCGIYRQNDKMSGSPFDFVHDMTENSGAYLPGTRGHIVSEWFTVLRDIENTGVLAAGFAGTHERMGQIVLKCSNDYFRHFKAVSRCEDAPLGPGETILCEDLIITGTAPARESSGDKSPGSYLSFDTPLKAFATEAASVYPPPAMPENQIGWCSWYYYFHELSEKTILENIDAARDLRDRLPIEYIQVDDGYQPAPGDWLETTKKFPGGMHSMADRISDAGFKPGIWLAPFMATDRSRLFREHPDWFVKKKSGKPRWITLWTSPYALGGIYGLDTTNPEVIDWLKMIIRTIVHEWGYDYLKLDFLYAATIDGFRMDQDVTRAQAFRRGFEAIREAADDDTYLLGCGVPLGIGTDLMNGARIAGDTAPEWTNFLATDLMGHRAAPGVPNAARGLFSRYFMHRKFFMADPDCLMGRFTHTRLNPDEVRTHATCVAMAGGPLIMSDNLTKLTNDSVELIQKLIPPVNTPAIPVDLFDSDIAGFLLMNFDRPFDPVSIIARINWSNRASDMVVDFARAGLDPDMRYHVFDLWEEKYYGVQTGRLHLSRVPAHATRLLAVRPVLEHPQLVSSSFHFTQGGAEVVSQEYDQETNVLAIRLSAPATRKGRVFVWTGAKIPEAAIINNSDTELEMSRDAGLCTIEFEMTGSAELQVRFRK